MTDEGPIRTRSEPERPVPTPARALPWSAQTAQAAHTPRSLRPHHRPVKITPTKAATMGNLAVIRPHGLKRTVGRGHAEAHPAKRTRTFLSFAQACYRPKSS